MGYFVQNEKCAKSTEELIVLCEMWIPFAAPMFSNFPIIAFPLGSHSLYPIQGMH